MNRYISLLRGINVSGKNKIPMPQLKVIFEELGFSSVSTYINSGNVLFNSARADKEELVTEIKKAIQDIFQLEIPVVVVTSEELQDTFNNAPDWWNTDNKEVYHNTIFMVSPTTVAEVVQVMGEPKPEYEKIHFYNNVIFWSADLKNFSKARWSKLASSSVNNKVTVRNANTVKKLVELAKA
ncbi:hypothetical protein A5881_002169 [Enterococcus termitis]|nr:hypothetical protein A5881_001510 [Enterococcus termitis]